MYEELNVISLPIPSRDEHNHPSTQVVSTFKDLDASGNWIGREPSDYQRNLFRAVHCIYKELARKPYGKMEDDELVAFGYIYQTLFREFNTPYFDWDRGSQAQQEFFFREQWAEAMQVLRQPL